MSNLSFQQLFTMLVSAVIVAGFASHWMLTY